MPSVKLGSRLIGDGQPIYLMADLGLTNGGDIDRAKELIHIAAESGVDAVKFQMLEAEKLLGDQSVEYTYPTMKDGPQTENMLEMFKGLEYSDDQWAELKQTADGRGLDMIVTCHYEGGVERTNRLDLVANKICTWSISHRRMIEQLAANGKPLIFDTGTITRADLIALEDVYKKAGGGDLVVLHDFHTDVEAEMNFRALEVYRQLGMVAGYTPQGRKDWLDFMSVGMDAAILEKRLTTSRDIPANGHWKAHEPDEFIKWVECIRQCERAMGNPVVEPTAQDLQDAKKYYKSAYLIQDVKQGDPIRQSDLAFKRPGTGVSSWVVGDNYLGRPYHRDYKSGEMLEHF